MKQIIMLGLALILLSSFATAFGVAPSSTEMIYSPNTASTVDLKIVNTENEAFTAAIYVEGDMAEYVKLSTASLDFSESDKEKLFSYTVNLPDKEFAPGVHETRVVIVKVPKAKAGQNEGISASLAINAKLLVSVPYEGKYVDAKLIIPQFEKGRSSNFGIEVTNLGSQSINDLQVVLDIYGPLNNKITTLTSKSGILELSEKKTLTIDWLPDLNNGNYLAVATVIFDGKNIKVEKPFTIGSLELDISSISVENFKLGGIARFDIFVANNWNLPVEGAYADVSVKDKQNKEYTQFKTAAANIDAYGTQKLEAYWDTAKVMPGTFNLEITLNYLGKSVQKIFEIVVQQDKITSRPVGGAVTAESPGSKNPNSLTYLLAIAVFVLIVVVGIIITVLIRINRRLKNSK